MKGTGEFFESLGLKPERPMALFAGLSEVLGGLLFALGFLTPLATLLMIGTMLVAIVKVHGSKGYWVTSNGYEYNFILIIVAIGIALTSAGAYSFLDRPSYFYEKFKNHTFHDRS